MKLELFLCWCFLALRAVHGHFQPREGQKSQSQPCRTRVLVTPSSFLQGHGAPGAAAWWPLAPDCFVPRSHSSRGSLQLLLLGEEPWGLFVFAVGCGILGTWEEFGVPSAA